MTDWLARFLRNPVGTFRRGIYKLFIAPLKYGRGKDYDAHRYWEDRFRRHGPSLRSVGDEGMAESEIRQAYAIQAGEVLEMLDRAGIGLAQARLLEIGCGNGYYSDLVRGRGLRKYAGFDITDVFFPMLRERFPGFEYVRGDITADRLPAEFDVVLMIDVIEHIVTEAKLMSALSNVGAMTAKGGVVAIAPVVPHASHSLFYVRFWAEEDVGRGLPGFDVVERTGRTLLLRKS